jgi:flagellar P-ring protein precursor FlgI
VLTAYCLLATAASAARLKISLTSRIHPNQLFGYGLVVGLNSTGDRQNTEFTVQTLANLLQDYNIASTPTMSV